MTCDKTSCCDGDETVSDEGDRLEFLADRAEAMRHGR